MRAVLSGGNFVPLAASEIPDSRDRALANRLVTAALRRHGHLNLVISHLLERGMPKKSGSFEAVLRLSLAQLLYLPDLGDHSAIFLAVEAVKRDQKSAHLSGLINALLRRGQAEAHSLRQAPLDLLFPDWLRKNWQRAYGHDAVLGFGEALLDGAPLDLTLKDEDPVLIEALGAKSLLADSVRIASRDHPVDALPGYAEGRWWVQDVAASLPARLLDLPQGARVLDLCAAPGGKTAQLCKAGYKVTALDNDAQRLERLRGNLVRLGYEAEIVEADAMNYRPDELFDGVLLDAPCSATGTFRRHPEVIWHRSAADITGRMAGQRKLLANALACLRPGGVLIYCVCSLEPEEGETQARWALGELPGLEDFSILDKELGAFANMVDRDGRVRTHPDQIVAEDADGTLDGFFIARFRRRVG